MAQTVVAVDGVKLANGAAGKAMGTKRPSMPPAKAAPKAKPKKAGSVGLAFEPTLHAARRRPARRRHLGASRERHHEPRRIDRLQDGGRAEIPAGWSQLATDIAVSKYFRKAGLHGQRRQVGETSVRQVVYRIAHTIREAGEKLGGYFAGAKEAETFEAELSYLLVNQYGAFNSPVWFNCGLYHRYEINGTGGNFAWREGSAPGAPDEIVETTNAYERPQCSACFIQAIQDDLMSIYEVIKSEARLFKYGSGTGTNFSAIRGKQEKLSGGGTSSGLMSFLDVLRSAAGATKSGGTTRRAAKMVCLDMDHPEISDFIGWKVREEKKAHALIAAGYSSDFNGEAYHTISGQNSNNSVRGSRISHARGDDRRPLGHHRPHDG